MIVVIVAAVVVFFVLLAAFGRWLQRRGRQMERHREDRERPS